jgi:hypothetical protein
MRDITDPMNAYRECLRHLWNTYFSGREDVGSSIDVFSRIEPLLFEGLIENELNYDGESDPETLPPPIFKVVPRERAPIIVKFLDEPGQAHRWGDGGNIYVGPEDIELDFIEYWDWSQWPIREFEYFLCRIARFQSHPQYEGREALIKAFDGRVFHDESK